MAFFAAHNQVKSVSFAAFVSLKWVCDIINRQKTATTDKIQLLPDQNPLLCRCKGSAGGDLELPGQRNPFIAMALPQSGHLNAGRFGRSV